jgi:hypothetical protein
MTPDLVTITEGSTGSGSVPPPLHAASNEAAAANAQSLFSFILNVFLFLTPQMKHAYVKLKLT